MSGDQRANENPSPEPRKSLILLVEDDPDIGDAISSVLEDADYEVMRAANGSEALDKLRGATVLPRLILLDLMMPIMDGRQFRAAQLSDSMLAEVPVVVLSAHVDVRQAASEMSAAGWLKKPIDIRALLRAVASI